MAIKLLFFIKVQKRESFLELMGKRYVCELNSELNFEKGKLKWLK
tara:strand:- start:1733 stop:1867 length:135 start_codon:yes stop_codon:yes gene_type:complete